MKSEIACYVNCALGSNFSEYLLDEVVFARNSKFPEMKANLIFHEGQWHLDNAPFDFILSPDMVGDWEFLFIK